QGTPPLVHFRLAPDEDLTDQSLESLCQGGVGNVPLVLVKLARREKPAWRNKHLMQLVYYGGLPDPGITGDQYQLRRATFNDAVEGGEQRTAFVLTSVQFFRNQNAVWPVIFSKREIVDFASRLPCGKTTPEVAL